MIDVSRQLPAAPKRAERRELKRGYAEGIQNVYARGAEVMPPEYLVTHADSGENRAHRIRAMALHRNAIRNAKRLKNHSK